MPYGDLVTHPTQNKTVYYTPCFQAFAIHVFFPLEYDITTNYKIPRCRLLTVLFPIICGRCTRLTLRLCRITKATVVAAIPLSKVNGCAMTSLSASDACDVL